MEPSPIVQRLNKASRIAIVCKNDFSGDSFCAALGLYLALKKAGKSVQIATVDTVPSKISFLNTHDIKNTVASLEGSIAVHIKTSKKNLSEMWYEESEQGVIVHIEPSHGTYFKKEDVELQLKPVAPELIVSVGASASLEIKKSLEQNQWLFEVPVLNIDTSVRNQLFGEFNAVDLKAPSRSEIVYDLLKVGTIEIGAETATALLAGIITQTNSFQSTKTSPQTFARAADLVKCGGKQQEIIRHLYKNKSFTSLKLIGQAFSSMKTYPEIGLVTTSIASSAPISSNDLETMLDEVIMTASTANVLVCNVNQNTAYVFIKDHIELQAIIKEHHQEVAPQLYKVDVSDPRKFLDTIKERFLGWLKFNQHVY